MNKGTASMKRKKAAAKRAVSQGLIVLGCLLICLIWVLPFLWMLGTSMRREIDSFNLPPAFWPEQWNIENYQKVFDMILFSNSPGTASLFPPPPPWLCWW